MSQSRVPPHEEFDLKVVIVEDEFIVALELRTLLEDMGHEVLQVVDTCSAALQYGFLIQPDLAIIDTRLGSETSEPVVQFCRQEGVPVIISSGHAIESLPHFASGYPLLSKPFLLPDVQDALREIEARS